MTKEPPRKSMSIIIFVIGLLIIINLLIHRNKIKERNESLALLVEHSPEDNAIFDDFMCLMVTDGSTIIRSKSFNVKGKLTQQDN